VKADRPGGAQALLVELQRRARFPLTATIELTRRCNLRCRHCYVDLDGHGGLPLETLVRVVDELAHAGALFLTFTGGEALLYEGWREILAHARRRACVVRLKTNATLLTDKDAAIVAALPVLSLDVSVYSMTPAVHDAVTGVAGSLKMTRVGVERARAAGARVTVQVPVMTTNQGAVDEVGAWASGLGCDLVVDPRISPSLDPRRDTSALVPTQEAFDSTLEAAWRHGLPRPRRPAALPPIDEAWPCLAAMSGLYVRADGEVWRCGALPVSFGSVLDQPIREIWDRSPSRAELARAAAAVPTECGVCDESWACHRCPAHAVLEHGGLGAPATIDCRLARARTKTGVAGCGARCDTAADGSPRVGVNTPGATPIRGHAASRKTDEGG
jgi:MoaA/NifB/PqqE/SkfB family radical SAM enzyme